EARVCDSSSLSRSSGVVHHDGITHEDAEGDEVVTDIYQNDNFRLTKFLTDKTWTNSFLIGKESELETMDGTTFKTTVTLNGGKLKIEFPKYVYTAEMVGDKLVEVNTIGNVTNKMINVNFFFLVLR
ncbi:uncharacterized protein V6R79_009479, partial [Siganus canaliculatus]